MFTRNFELKKDAIFSPLTKTIYSKIVNVSRDRDKTMEERPVGRELECSPSGEPKKKPPIRVALLLLKHSSLQTNT
jgi:hypothetical protein